MLHATFLRTREGSAYVCAGLANGKMAVYNHYSIGVSTLGQILLVIMLGLVRPY